MTIKTFVVTVSYEVVNPLLSQFNIHDLLSSCTFLVKTGNELSEKVITTIAAAIVKKANGIGSARNFRTTSLFELPGQKFYDKTNKPALFDLSALPAPSQEEAEEMASAIFNPVNEKDQKTK